MRHFILLTALVLGVFNLYTARAGDAQFALTTKAFSDSGALPILYTCDGKNISPELSWLNAPAKTRSFAIIFSDPDAPGKTFYHWALFNIPKKVNKLDQGIDSLPDGVIAGKNSWGELEYKGPCPPKGPAHNYVFTLYALDTELALPRGADGDTIIAAMNNHILQQTQLSAMYSR